MAISPIPEYLDTLEAEEFRIHKLNVERIKQLRGLFAQFDSDWSMRPVVQMKVEKSTTAPRIVNLAPASSLPTVGEAIREAIAAQTGNFKGSDLLNYIRKRYVGLKINGTIVAKRLYQFRKSGFIEIAVPGKTPTSPNTYRVAKK